LLTAQAAVLANQHGQIRIDRRGLDDRTVARPHGQMLPSSIQIDIAQVTARQALSQLGLNVEQLSQLIRQLLAIKTNPHAVRIQTPA